MKKFFTSLFIALALVAQSISIVHAVEHSLDPDHAGAIQHECTLCSSSETLDNIADTAEKTVLDEHAKGITPNSIKSVSLSTYASHYHSRAPPVL